MKKIMVAIIVVISTAFLVIVSIHLKEEGEQLYKYDNLDAVIAGKGDTLWGIAKKYSSPAHDIRQVLYIIDGLNSEDKGRQLQIGQLVYVPLFNCMQ